jgi:chromosome segregation ATPase
MADSDEQQSEYSEDFENTSLGDYNIDGFDLDLDLDDGEQGIREFPESEQEKVESAKLETESLMKLKDQLDEFDQSIVTGNESPVGGIDSKLWKRQMTDFDQILQKCVANEQKRTAESSFITSTIAKNSRHTRPVVEKQLQIALHQINSYRKENEFITKKLDTSIVHQELERQKQTIHDQELKIRQLVEENRALQSVRRGHEKQLLVVEREKELQPEKDKSLQRDHHFLEKKLKSLKNQVVNLQVRDRIQYQENRDLKEKNLKLKVRVQALEMSDSVAISIKRQGTNSLGGIGEEGMSMEVPSVHMIGDDSKGESGSEVEQDRIRSENSRLKSIVSNQRSSFRQQLTTLQSRLEKSLDRRKYLETELERREKEMKVQVRQCPFHNTILTLLSS